MNFEHALNNCWCKDIALFSIPQERGTRCGYRGKNGGPMGQLAGAMG
ncbi:MAG: hypothetical protein J6Y99_03500 [Bacteroidales bacterium]|nr:hypothetical protein [Bacteroidales bacterium]